MVRSLSHRARGPARPPRVAISPWQKKLMAAGLTLSLAMFPFLYVPQAVAQDTPSSTGAPASTAAASAHEPATVPVPSPQQVAKAREYFRKGTRALRSRNSSQALTLFAKAHLLDPGNGPYLAAYELARQQWVGGLLLTASQDQQAGKTASAKQQLEQALSLDPDNPYVREHI